MRLRHVLSPAWRAYYADLDTMDRQLDRMEAEGVSLTSRQYMEAWTDRMAYAANCYPGAPESEPGPAEGYVFLIEPDAEPEAGA